MPRQLDSSSRGAIVSTAAGRPAPSRRKAKSSNTLNEAIRRSAAGGSRAPARHRRQACGGDPRRPRSSRITHSLADILRARILAIACGYEDADDLDRLRTDPAFKLACGRLPDSGRDLCSQPTMSRWRTRRACATLIRLGACWSISTAPATPAPPAAVTLDIDDTVDVVHGHQQLSLFNAHYDERCFLPIHVYDTATSRPVAVILRPGKTPSRRRGARSSAPAGPAHPPALADHPHHHPRRRPLRPPEVMDWCEDNGIDYVFGLAGTKAAGGRKVDEAADDIRAVRARRQRGRGARLCRDPLRRQVLAAGAPRRRPHRGDPARPRHPLRRHQPRRPARPNGSTTASTAPADRPRT